MEGEVITGFLDLRIQEAAAISYRSRRKRRVVQGDERLWAFSEKRGGRVFWATER